MMQETVQTIPGPAGEIELSLMPVEGNPAVVAIVCHPHPLHGGSMNNKVVTTLARVFNSLGYPAVRFNFRGVGQSAGEFDEGVGEAADLMAVVEWVKARFPTAKLALAGFSFGSFVALRAYVASGAKIMVTVAPPLERMPYETLVLPRENWIVVQGDQDEIVDAQGVYDWVDSLSPKPMLIRMPEASHFFHGQLISMRDRLRDELSYFAV